MRQRQQCSQAIPGTSGRLRLLVIAKGPIDAPLNPGNVTVTPDSDVLLPPPGAPLPDPAPPLTGGPFWVQRSWTTEWTAVLGFNTSSSPFVTARQQTREDLLKIHVPIAWILGGPGDIAYTGFQADWAMPLDVPMFAAEHPYLIHQLGWSSEESQLEFAEIAIHWLDLTLSGNKRAADYLLGTPCGFCDNPNWSTQSRNWDDKFLRR